MLLESASARLCRTPTPQNVGDRQRHEQSTHSTALSGRTRLLTALAVPTARTSCNPPPCPRDHGPARIVLWSQAVPYRPMAPPAPLLSTWSRSVLLGQANPVLSLCRVRSQNDEWQRSGGGCSDWHAYQFRTSLQRPRQLAERVLDLYGVFLRHQYSIPSSSWSIERCLTTAPPRRHWDILWPKHQLHLTRFFSTVACGISVTTQMSLLTGSLSH